MQTTRVPILALVAGLALASQGCMSRMIGEGAETALGPKGEYFEVKPVAANPKTKALGEYRNFELGEVRNNIGSNLPPDFVSLLKQEFTKVFEDMPHDKAGKTLAYNIDLLHYEKGNAKDQVFGPLEEVVAQVDLVDKQSGQVVASGVAVGRTGKTVGQGVKWKAWGLSRALYRWTSAYYPNAPEEKERPEQKKS